MTKLILVGLLALSLGVAACDSEAKSDTTDAGVSKATAELSVDDPKVIKISVPTIQCKTCEKTIRKELSTLPGTEGVEVDVDAKTVFVRVANNTPAMREQLEGAITQAGYSTDTKTRDQTAYDNLPDCCKEGGSHED